MRAGAERALPGCSVLSALVGAFFGLAGFASFGLAGVAFSGMAGGGALALFGLAGLALAGPVGLGLEGSGAFFAAGGAAASAVFTFLFAVCRRRGKRQSETVAA